jgi:branched-chain amino acid transport system substrate-binding protein
MSEDLLPEETLKGTVDASSLRSVSRRDFIKLAGIAGATLGAGSGMAALVTSCGGTSASATNTSAPVPSSTTAPPSSTTTVSEAATTTSVTASVETGPELKIGYVGPVTGALAAYGATDGYCVDRWREFLGDGIVCGDGKKHPVTIVARDSQSDSNRAAQVAGDLITNDKVNVLGASSGPDTICPVVGQAEANQTPVVSAECPLQSYLGKNTAYQWAYHVSFGGEDVAPVIVNMLNSIPNNKKCGLLFDNSADGNTFLPFYQAFLGAAGFECVNGGQFQPGAEDFTAQISAFKRAGVETVSGNCSPPDFTNFWKQAAQQGLKAKTCTIGKALAFPDAVNALGDVGNGLMKELTWHRSFPWKSYLTGETCAELADDYEAKTGEQQTSPLLHYLVGEMAIYVLKNAADPTDKNAVLKAIQNMKMETSIAGPIDFTATPMITDLSKPVTGYGRKTKNVWGMGIGGAQWQMKGGKWKFTEVVIDKTVAPFIPDSVVEKVIPLAL